MKVKQTKQNEQKIQIKKRGKKGKAFTLVELVVVILIIAILATATFLGGATIIKQSRKTKAVNDLRNYASYVQDMFYSHPEYASTEIADENVVEDVNKYLTKDIQFNASKVSDVLKDSWGHTYNLSFGKVDGKAEAGILIWSNGANQENESHLEGVVTKVKGDDLAVFIKMVNGEVTTTNIDASVVMMLDGNDQNYAISNVNRLSFRSSAEISTFKEVKVDNKVVAPSNYDVTEGSTIVTFKPEYSKLLSVGQHTIDIISKTGTATTNFNINNDEGGGSGNEQPTPTQVIVNVVNKEIKNSFEELKTLSTEIASDNTITSTSTTAHGLTVGDHITIDGLTCYVAGFNHDKDNGETGITFVVNYGITHNMNTSVTNAGGYAGSEMYTYLKNTVLQNLKTISANAKQVTKKSDAGNKDKKTLKAAQDKAWLLSYEEVFPTDYANYIPNMGTVVAGQGTCYPIFTAKNSSRTTIYDGYWWLRSTCTDGAWSFWRVRNDGKCEGCVANYYSGIVFGFCI